MPRESRARLLALPFAALIVTACGSHSLAPFQPEITNAANSFQFQATGLAGVSTTKTYQWTNSGTSANVNQASSITGGTASLEIMDGGGASVYSRNLADNGTFQTSAGGSGSWTVKVKLQNVRGTVNFRVQTP